MKCLMRTFFAAELITMLTLSAVCGLSGCGGGTAGTGGIGITGSLSSTAGSALAKAGVTVPVANARVSVSGTNDYDVTDDQGNFYISTDREGSDLTLLVDAPSFSSSFVIRGIPDAAAQVSLSLDYETDLDEIVSGSTKFEDEDGNEID
jgi:hypothetical protein